MRITFVGACLLAAAILATLAAYAQRPSNDVQAERPNDASAGTQRGGEAAQPQDPVARGRYLAHDVAMCVICHSPKDAAGRVIDSRKFEGDVIPLNSPFARGRPWADRAPNLRTFASGREEEMFVLLTTGLRRRTGGPADGPMPPFRLIEEDAKAIIAYLKSLN